MSHQSFLSWSSGKDAAYTLYLKSLDNQLPELLLTTVNKDFQRVSMHGLRTDLLEKQAARLGIELYKIPLAKDVNMETYNLVMEQAMFELSSRGFSHAVFGDVFLRDLKEFRINQLKKVGFTAEFPLWQRNTKKLALEIIQSGIKAIVVTVNADRLPPSFVGRLYDENFLNDLPKNVDWCGENGEFHTFVYDAPNFSSPIVFGTGEKIYKEYLPCSKSDIDSYGKSAKNMNEKWNTGFWYIDLYSAE